MGELRPFGGVRTKSDSPSEADIKADVSEHPVLCQFQLSPYSWRLRNIKSCGSIATGWLSLILGCCQQIVSCALHRGRH